MSQTSYGINVRSHRRIRLWEILPELSQRIAAGRVTMSEKGQYAILKKRLALPGFCYIDLPGGWILQYHRDVPVQSSKDGRILLLGIAWQFLPEKGTPAAEMDKLCEACPGEIGQEKILEMEESWCGRYLLVCQGVIYTDACSLLPVYYSADGIAGDCTLLEELAGGKRKNYEMPEHRIMNWMPGPLTQYERVRHLLPSQLYNYEEGKVISRQLLAAHYPGIPGEQERLARIIDCFDFSLRQMQAALPDTKLLVAITGGHDSRTLLALAKHAGIDFDAFTLWHDEIYEDDLAVPKKLCRAAGIAHYEIPRQERADASSRIRVYQDHISGQIWDEDRLYYAHRQFDPLTEQFGNTALLRSGVWPNVMEWYRRSFTADGPGFDFYDWFGVQKGSLEERSMQEYFAWHREHPQKGLSPCNVFYWDQRNGCWLSAIETGFTLFDRVLSLQPANCRYLMTMLMEFPEEERIINHHQYKIVEKACPQMAAIPYGGHKRQGEKAGQNLLEKVQRGIGRLRKLGLRKTIKTYRSMIHTRREEKRMLRKRGRNA